MDPKPPRLFPLLIMLFVVVAAIDENLAAGD